MKLSQAVETFLLLKRAALAPKTAQAYEQHLSRFAQQFGELELRQVTNIHLSQFLIGQRERPRLKSNGELRGGKLSPATIQGDIRSLHIFCRWALTNRLIENDPSASIKTPRAPAQPKALTEPQVRALLDFFQGELGQTPVTPKQPRSKWPEILRTRAMFNLLMDTRRVHPLTLLTVEDVHLDEGCVMLTDRYGHQGEHRISDLTADSLRVYLAGRSAGPVFLKTDGKPMNLEAVRAVLKHLRERLGISASPRYWNEMQANLARTLFERVIASREVQLRSRPAGPRRLPWLTLKRDYCLFLLMLDTGLRLSEVTGLQLEHVNLAANYVIVAHGKGDKRRTVGIGPDTASVLLEYIGERKQGPLFLTYDDKPLHPPGVYQALERIAERAGIYFSPHQLRHTNATFRLMNEMPPEQVQQQLGHSSFDITRRYVLQVEEQAAIHASHRFSVVHGLLSARQPAA